MSDGFDAVQMQQMQAMLSMASMGTGMPPPAPPGGPDYGAPGGAPPLPQIDPAMVQSYMQMFQYLQQGMQQGGLAGAPGVMPGMPPMPFPAMAPTYAQPYGAPDPTVNVSVEGMKFQYQLTDDDLHKVFSRYGSVKQIRVDDAGGAAQISFQTVQDAQAAMNDLNGKVLNGLEGTLRITWSNATAPAPPYPSVPSFPGWGGFPPTSAAPWPGAGSIVPSGYGPGGGQGGCAAGSGGHLESMDARGQPPHGKGIRKYTCRFLIGIDNDTDFQVARRIIGAKGANMKRIVQATEAKLRLRGIGSGYFEGAGQKESSEPLQLCISCTSAEGYKTAVRNVEDHLKRVYDEYRQFCRDNGKAMPDLQINLSENQLVYSSRTSPEDRFGGKGGASYGNDDVAESPNKKDPRRSRRRGAGASKRDSKGPEGEVERGEPGPNAPTIEEIENFIDERNEARRACNFAEADRVREVLHSRGVALMDEPGGRGRGAEVTTWRYWRD